MSVAGSPRAALTVEVELRDRLIPLFGADIAIERLALLAGGASKEAWALDLRTPQGVRELQGRRAFVSERVSGETIGRRIVQRPELADARALLPAQMAEELAKIHAIPAER